MENIAHEEHLEGAKGLSVEIDRHSKGLYVVKVNLRRGFIFLYLKEKF